MVYLAELLVVLTDGLKIVRISARMQHIWLCLASHHTSKENPTDKRHPFGPFATIPGSVVACLRRMA